MGFSVGDRVKIHPSSDWFARGVRYGEVLGVGRKWIRVLPELSPNTLSTPPVKLRFLEIVGRVE